MADRLYLSLWYPNFRLSSLAPAMVSVLRQFAAAGGSARVHAAAAYPISWSETPTYQRVYAEDEVEESAPEPAVSELTELLHDDFAYEVEVPWDLRVAEAEIGLDPSWNKEARIVRVAGFGPEFDEGAYGQNGQIRVDFGIDTPFLQEQVELDRFGAEQVKKNVEKLVEFTNRVTENCGISSRLLWTESGESLAQKLIARLQRVN